jgi:protein-disulfide isomerase
MSTAAVKKQSSNPANRQGLIIIVVVVVVVVFLAIVAIALSGNKGGDIDYANLPQERAADGGFQIGNPNAPITLIEFSDFGCPHCQEYHPIIQEYLQNYVATSKAKFEYRMFPTAGGQLSVFTGELLQCGEQQKAGSFWQGYKLMFDYATSGRYTQDVGRLYAQDAGLSYAELLTCRDNLGSDDQVNKDVNFGTQHNVNGTPAVMVRYGDSAPDFITYNGTTYDRGGAPYNVLAAITEAVQ